MNKQRKAFLTQEHDEGGSISWRVSTASNGIYGYTVDAELILRDCYKKITLDFDCVDVEQVDSRIKKVSNLIFELDMMRLALMKAKAGVTPVEKRFYY